MRCSPLKLASIQSSVIADATAVLWVQVQKRKQGKKMQKTKKKKDFKKRKKEKRGGKERMQVGVPKIAQTMTRVAWGRRRSSR